MTFLILVTSVFGLLALGAMFCAGYAYVDPKNAGVPRKKLIGVVTGVAAIAAVMFVAAISFGTEVADSYRVVVFDHLKPGQTGTIVADYSSVKVDSEGPRVYLIRRPNGQEVRLTTNDFAQGAKLFRGDRVVKTEAGIAEELWERSTQSGALSKATHPANPAAVVSAKVSGTLEKFKAAPPPSDRPQDYKSSRESAPLFFGAWSARQGFWAPRIR